ncbi:MAG: DNA polymerase III subunit gamma/tau [Nitrospinaceae bacterium]|nr:MAG: DNA polymerase III subunit gamma/tau [Nitrospinaceae bacterium]
MEFQVSARKWRPQKFSELVGQEHIVRTLINAIELNRVSHAYLFSGTRGVGKTTSARILAKALNCQNPNGCEPCDACPPCLEIKEGTSLDVQEIDGASNNGVGEVRDLVENIQYAASSLKYKVYIIDEVHMLSKSAFNALLKTLEEPPPRVIFIFATTELNKIPETILSRCQCFEFKPLSHKQIIQQLDLIGKHEGIEIDPKSLDEIAKTGSGSMRDAQSLLDQVIAFSGKQVTPGSVESVLGIVGQSALETFVDHLIAGDPSALIEQVQQIANSGKDLNFFCRDLVETIRNLLMFQVAKKPETILDSETCDFAVLARQSQALHKDQWQQMFTVLSRAESEMKRSSLSRAVFEMAVLRLTDIRPFNEIDALIETINRAESEPVSEDRLVITPQPKKESTPLRSDSPGVSREDPEENSRMGSWENIKKEIVKKKASFGHYLMVCELIKLTDSTIHLSVSDPYTKELIEKEESIQAIREGVKAVCQRAVQVQLSLKTQNKTEPGNAPVKNGQEKKTLNDYNDKSQIAESEIIREALDIFGGVVTR